MGATVRADDSPTSSVTPAGARNAHRGRRNLILAIAVAVTISIVGPPPLALASGNDYPTSIYGCRAHTTPPGPITTCNLKGSAQDSWWDPWNFLNRECTSF